MYVVEMSAVAARRQHHREITAGAPRQMMQEVALGARRPPIALDADFGPVGQAEARDIDRQAERMLAETARMVAGAAAGIGAEMVDAVDIPPEIVDRDTLQHAALEIVDPGRQRATHDRRLIERDIDPADAHRGVDMAASIRRVELDGTIGDRMRVERGEALPGGDHRRWAAKAARQHHGKREQQDFGGETTHSGIVPAGGRSLLCRLADAVNAAGNRRAAARGKPYSINALRSRA